MATACLLRTNPKLTSNIKIVIDSDNCVYLDSFFTDSLSHNRFSRIKINPSNFLSYDFYKFFGKGTVPSSLAFEVSRISSDLHTVTTPDYQFEHQYNYGASRLSTAFYSGTNSILAPLLIDKSLPRYFIIFQVPGAKALSFERNPTTLLSNVSYLFQGSVGSTLSYNNVIYTPGSTFTTNSDGGSVYHIIGNGWIQISDSDYEFNHSLSDEVITKQYISDSNIVKIFDLHNSDIGMYIKKHLSDPIYTPNPVDVDFLKKEITYTGISLEKGILTSITERMDEILEKELSMIDFDNYITKGYERNNLICPNLLNLEYCFDGKNDGKINRYFGLYVDELDLSELIPDVSMMCDSLNRSNPFLRTFQSYLSVPLRYDFISSDSLGVPIIPKTVISGFIPLNISSKPSFYYIKDKFDNFYKINNQASTDIIRLNDTNVQTSNFIGYNESIQVPATYSKVKGKSVAMFSVKDYITNSSIRISVLYKGIYQGHIYGDHLPTIESNNLPYGEGDNYSFYFYPYGNPINIAKAISKAFINRFKGKLHLMAKYDGDEVIISSTISGKGMDEYSLFIENLITNRNEIIKFGGGSETEKNRIIVDTDLNDQITENTRILTDKGYTKIRSIAPCIEDSNNKKVVISEDDNAEIKIIHGYAQFYNESKIKLGVMHIYELVDMDMDFHESSYSKSYYNEYGKYFAVRELEKNKTYKMFGFGEMNAKIKYQPGMGYPMILNNKNNNIPYEYFIHKIKPETWQVYIGSEGYQFNYLTGEFTKLSDSSIVYYSDVAHESTVGLIDGYDVEWDFDDINGTSYTFVFTPGMENTEIDPGRIMTYWTEFTSNGIGPAFYDISFKRIINGKNCYFVMFGNSLYSSLQQYMWLPYDTDTDTIYQPSITFNTYDNTEYEILEGDPYFIETKYLEDDELKKFTGFNNMAYRNRYLDIDNPDLVENKIKIFDKENTVTEYDKLYENVGSKNILTSRIVPTINKWVINGKNIREDEYRLNISHIFGELNFSPSHIDDTQNPYYFTHEWLYLIGTPEGITKEDLKKSDSYFSKPFDESKLADESDDYFSKYFTIDEHVIKDNIGNYEQIAVPHQIKYSTFEKISKEKYVTFFRGIRIELNENYDHTGYKFSAILNIKRTNQLIYEEPFSINIIKNDKWKNITYIVNITIDDYKIIDDNGKIKPSYLYLYIMNSLKYYIQNLNSYGYGIDFNYPTVTGLTLRRNNIAVTGFKGYRLPIKTDLNGLSNPDYLKFAKKYKVLDYLLPVNGNLNRIIGIDNNGAIVITSDNAFISTGIYDVDKPTTALRIVNDELLLKPNGITMVNIPSLSVYGNLNPFGVNYGVYDLSYINWYHENGGQDVYKIINKLISFASLYKLTNEQNELVNYKAANGGILLNMDKLGLQFVKPNQIDKYSIISVNEIKKQVPKITDQIVTDYEQAQTKIDPKAYYRYSGKYKPKLKKVLWFKTDKLELAFGNTNKKWSDLKFMWSDLNYGITYNDLNIDRIDNPYSFMLRGYNTLFDFSIENFGFINNMYYHKYSDNKILKLDKPIYKSVDEIAIDKKNQSIFSSDWDAKYYRYYRTKNQFKDIDGYQSLMDTKSFLGSHIFNIKKETILNINPLKIINGEINPNMDMNSNHVIWNLIDKTYSFKISGKNIFMDWMVDNYYDEFVTYFKDSSIDTFKKYVELNILKTVSIDSTIIYTKYSGKDGGLWDFETNEILLIRNGFTQNRMFKNSFDVDGLTLNLSYQKQFDSYPVFNMKFKITT